MKLYGDFMKYKVLSPASMLVFVLFLFITSCATVNVDYQNELVNSSDGIKIFRTGTLSSHKGVKFLKVSGTPYEVGLQYGVLLKDDIKSMYKDIEVELEKYTGTFFLKKWIANFVINRKISKIKSKLPKDYLTELEGMADGSGISLKKIEIIAFLPQLRYDISCTSFLIKDKNKVIHGRNLDWNGLEFLSKYPVVADYNVKGKKRFISFTYAGYPAVYTGVNYDGLSLSININTSPADKKGYNTGIPIPFKTRQLLESSSTLDEIDNLISNYSSHAWFITAASNKDKSGAIYELTRGEVIKNKINDTYIAIENLGISPKNRVQYSPIWLHSDYNYGRENQMKRLMKSDYKKNLVEKAYRTLKDVSYYNYSHSPYYNSSINNQMTIQSIIFDNSKGTVYFAYAPRYAASSEFYKYNYKLNKVSIFKKADSIISNKKFKNRLAIKKWSKQQFGNKKLTKKDHEKKISYISKLLLDETYKNILLSDEYLEIGEYKKSLNYSERYIKSYPNHFDSYENKLKVFKKQKKYLDAISIAKKIINTKTIPPRNKFYKKIEIVKLYEKLMNDEVNINYKNEVLAYIESAKDQARKFYVDEYIQGKIDELDDIKAKYL